LRLFLADRVKNGAEPRFRVCADRTTLP